MESSNKVNIEIEESGEAGHTILYYHPILKQFCFIYRYEGEVITYRETKLTTVVKIIRDSWDEINLTVNYPITLSKKKIKRINDLMGHTTSNKKFKARMNAIVGLLLC